MKKLFTIDLLSLAITVSKDRFYADGTVVTSTAILTDMNSISYDLFTTYSVSTSSHVLNIPITVNTAKSKNTLLL